jgi:hypothetical protein
MEPSRILPPLALAAAALLAGCSGGGGSDPAGQGSTLSISLMDAPVDGVTEVNVEIAAIWIKPTGSGPATKLPLTKVPLQVNLLELTEQNAAILIDEAVIEPGSYEWLAMDVNATFDGIYDSYVMTDVGGQEEIRVPSGRLRLVSGFDVPENEAVQLLFDWDMRKGLVDPPGQPGYLLKPAFRMLDVTAYGVLQGTVALNTITDAANDCDADDTDLDVGNVVYVFAGADVDPDDVDGIAADPVATADVTQNTAGDYVYRTLLQPGAYTVAFTCQASNDDPETDETGTPKAIVFRPDQNVTIAGSAVTADF